MKIIFYLGHPAHFHLFFQTINQLKSKKNEIMIIIKTKDVLKSLLKNANMDYVNLAPFGRKNNKFSIAKGFIDRLIKLLKIARKFKPNLLMGSAGELVQAGKLLNIPSLIFFEDDLSEVKQWTRLTAPFANSLICPTSCSVGKWKYKTIKYNSYHELAYLHKNYFAPDFNLVKSLFGKKEKFFILRLSKLTAYHDIGKLGISTQIAKNIIKMLQPYGKIYITSERELNPEFEPYRIEINPIHIHHALYYAYMCIGDSQTMAAEAAVLGTPSIRFNDFVGKLGYLEELEHKYGLTYGIKTYESDKLYDKITKLINIPNLKQEWQKRREKMLSDKIDLTAFMVWLIENYPKSAEVMRRSPDYQLNFK